MTESLIALISVGIGYALCYFVMRDSVKITLTTLRTVLDERKPVVRATRPPVTPPTPDLPSEPDGPREPTMITTEAMHQAFVPPDLIGLRNAAFLKGEKHIKDIARMHQIADEIGNG